MKVGYYVASKMPFIWSLAGGPVVAQECILAGINIILFFVVRIDLQYSKLGHFRLYH